MGGLIGGQHRSLVTDQRGIDRDKPAGARGQPEGSPERPWAGVAAGTSPAESVTALVAARWGQGDIAAGSTVAYTIINLFAILVVTVVVHRPFAQRLGGAEATSCCG